MDEDGPYAWSVQRSQSSEVSEQRAGLCRAVVVPPRGELQMLDFSGFFLMLLSTQTVPQEDRKKHSALAHELIEITIMGRSSTLYYIVESAETFCTIIYT